jgi:hypothetical protein
MTSGADAAFLSGRIGGGRRQSEGGYRSLSPMGDRLDEGDGVGEA